MKADATQYPTARQFERILLTEDLEGVVNGYVFRGTPYVFRRDPSDFGCLREMLAKALSICEESILVVGSAKTGFSLNPETRFRPFSDASDIDVLVHDDRLFDKIWEILLRWHYPRRYSGLHETDRSWAGDRKKEVYWGWFQPDKIRFTGISFPRSLEPLRDISCTWFDAFNGLSRDSRFSRRRVSGRLYRTLAHARLYNLEGLRQIRESLRAR